MGESITYRPYCPDHPNTILSMVADENKMPRKCPDQKAFGQFGQNVGKLKSSKAQAGRAFGRFGRFGHGL